MIPKGYVTGKDFHKLTKAEAAAFVIFELKELERHKKDIKKIEEDIKELYKAQGIGAKK